MENDKVEEYIRRLEKLNETISNMEDDDDDGDFGPPDGFFKEMNDVLESLTEEVQQETKKERDENFNVKIKVRKLFDNAKYIVNNNVIDLYAHTINKDSEYECIVGFGVEIIIPKNYLGLIVPYTGLIGHNKDEPIKTNIIGFLRGNENGELIVSFKSFNTFEYIVKTTGDKIAQLIIIPYPNIDIIEE